MQTLITFEIMAKERDTKYDDAYQYYLDGLSLDQVAEKIGVTRQCVFKAFKVRKLQLRGPNFRPVQEYDGKKFSLRNTGYYSLTTDDRLSMHRYIWEKEKGPIPDGWDVHHVDEDKSHNEISNLECLPKADHTRKHGFKNNQYTKNR